MSGNGLMILSQKLANRFGMGAEGDVLSVLKATAFKGPATDAQLTALLVVAQQYALNPFTKEIYAFPDKNNGIVPVVGVDGWARIINDHGQFDGMEFDQDDVSCTCRIYRKDRSRAIQITEYMAECKRDIQGPWKSHPRRMLRHKAMIQCARIAFGYGGIYDQDEAERIIESKEIDMGSAEVVGTRTTAAVELPPYPADKFEANLPTWRKLVEDGTKTVDAIGATISTKNTLSDDQVKRLRALSQAPAATGEIMASAAQIDIIKTAADAAAVGSADIFNTFDITSYDDITASMVDPVLDFIANPISE